MTRVGCCIAASLLLLACTQPGEETTPAGTGGGPVVPDPPDPLGLAQCEGTPAAWSEPVPLGYAGWEGDDPNGIACGLRGFAEAALDRRVICSGENNHGVSQSTRWHAHLVRQLVHQRGVRTVAFEAPAAAVAPWNRYLDSGDPADLAQGFVDSSGSLGNSVEQERLIEALRAVNAELPDGERLQLTGFDVAVQPVLTRSALLDYLAVVQPDEVAAWTSALPTLSGGVDWQAAGDSAEALHAQLEANHDAYAALSDETRWRDARRDAANLRDGYRFLELYFAGNFSAGDATYREPGMIRNVEDLVALTANDEPLLLVAHDLHCARDYTIGTNIDGQPQPALGAHLASTLGTSYMVVGQLYQAGSFLFDPQTTSPLVVASDGLEAALAATTAAPALLTSTTSDVVAMDASWTVWNQGMVVPQGRYDALLWLRDVTPTSLR